MSTGLRAAMVRGVSWTGLAQVFGYAASLVAIGASARYLEARAFGIEAAAAVVVGVWTIAADLGLGRALVQRRDVVASHLTGAFWVGLAGSLLCAALLWGTARFWSGLFFGDPGQMAAVLPTMGLGLVFAGFGAVPRAQMERAYRFGALAWVSLCATVCWGVTLVVLAIAGEGVWSLIWGYVARCAVLGLGPWVLNPVWVFTRFGPRDVGPLLGFGSKWVGSHLVGYFQQNLDYFLIGRFLGSGALGYYALAYRVIALPQTRLTQVISRVTFPAFSSLQNDLPRLGRAYLSTVRFVSLLVFPMMAVFALAADPGIPLLMGPEKALVAPLLVLLCPAGAARAVAAAVGLIFFSTGRPGLALMWNVGGALFMLLAVRLGVGWGVEGAAVAVSAGAVLLTLVSQSIANRLVDLRIIDYVRSLLPAAACGASVLVVGGAAKWLAFGRVDDLVLLGLCALAGCVGCVLSLLLLTPEVTREGTGMVRLLWSRDTAQNGEADAHG
ncbi:MAG: lipopolysaccharide biosynthesis protein [Candidatus Latescibacteria bacterium]|nr:lipopolysaccharide biosynthesis protein [Candidatus Latescibacterota bacterium]